jgi:hypothetical protein
MKTKLQLLFFSLVAFLPVSAQNDLLFAMDAKNDVELDEDFASPEIILNKFSPIDFNVAVNGQQDVTITWTVKSTPITSKYTILRSTNGKKFSEWRIVEGANSAGQQIEYLEIDNSPSSKNTYYRIMKTDVNGSVYYSEIRLIKADELSPSKSLAVYSYPAESDSANQSLNTNDVLLVLQDTHGEMHYSRAYYIVDNGEIIAVSLHQKFANGIYTITASSKDELVGNTLTIK